MSDESDEPSDSRSFVKSFARGMTVIHAFANASRPLSIAEISHRVDVSRAAVRRLLHTLSELGYVRTVGLRFELTPRTLQLGHAFTSSNTVAANLQPVISRVAEQLGTFCAVVVPDNDQAMLMCVAGTSRSSAPPNLYSGVGSKLPLYASASGHQFLSALTSEQLDAYFARVRMLPLTRYTPTQPQHVRTSIDAAREHGYSICDRTFAGDASSIAVPVWDQHGGIRAAVIAVVRAHQLEQLSLRSTVLPALQSACEEAGRQWCRADVAPRRAAHVGIAN